MPPVRSIKNQYRGINAHLHSYWQSEGGWDEFHTNHIADLVRLLRVQLLPMGYTAGIELLLTVPQMLGITEYEVKQYRAIGLYESDPSKKGQPVAWIELLSPSNKPGGQDAERYRDKRTKILQSGIVFVEIDYLHESSPTFDGIPNYNRRAINPRPDPDSHPYHIVVVDPRPDFWEGQGKVNQFDVDDSIPIITIPLNADDVLKFDFGVPYHKTFEEMIYGAELVDYNQLPINFERYSDDDQARIVSRILTVLMAAQNGVDLEQAPLPVTPIPLEAGLLQLQSFLY